MAEWKLWSTEMTIGGFSEPIKRLAKGLNTDPQPSPVLQRFYRLVEISY